MGELTWNQLYGNNTGVLGAESPAPKRYTPDSPADSERENAALSLTPQPDGIPPSALDHEAFQPMQSADTPVGSGAWDGGEDHIDDGGYDESPLGVVHQHAEGDESPVMSQQHQEHESPVAGAGHQGFAVSPAVSQPQQGPAESLAVSQQQRDFAESPAVSQR